MLILLVALAWCAGLAAEDWPEFRGPTGQGHSTEKGLPLTWSEKENIRWKTALPGLGWSSPAILGDRIWLTTAADGGRSLRAVAVDRESGKILADVEVFRLERPGTIHEKNSHASPTPILERDRVYVHYGPQGTACLNAKGEVVWRTRLSYAPGHGPGGSPALYEDLLILNCDGTDVQYVVALDKATGKVRWRKDRAGLMAFSTPLVVDGQVITVGGRRTISYDVRTGKELWSVSYGDGFSNVPRPVAAHGMVYVCTGFYQPEVLAVRLDGRLAWRHGRSVPLTSSPLVAGEELYMVSDNGIGTCLDARTGRECWRQRLGGSFSASPVYADGRIYFLSEEGETTVIAPGREFRRLALNRLDGRFLASMAVSGGALYLRSDRHLYRIENRP
jgi:outer membrane protein assembly factor BamB